MQIKPAQLNGFLAKPSCQRVLVYGPDHGQVTHVAGRLLKGFGDEIAVFDGDALAGQAMALTEAATAGDSLFGGRRAIRVRAAGDRCTKTLKELFEAAPGGCPVVVEAGDLAASSSLRKLFEDPKAAAMAGVPCYLAEERDRVQLIRGLFAEEGKSISADAVAALVPLLPPDSLGVRSEIAKLLMYLGDRPTCTADDVLAVIDDGAEFPVDDAIFAAAEGRPDILIKALRGLGSDAGAMMILRMAQRHFQRLASVRAQMDAGARDDDAVSALRPPVFWKLKGRFKTQLPRWDQTHLERAIGRLTEAELQFKQTGYPGDTLVRQALLDIAVETKDRGGKR